MPETKNLGLDMSQQKNVGKSEFILYLLGVFFYTCMTGMIGEYRNKAYVVNVLRLSNNMAGLYNSLLTALPFVINFFIAMYIDNRKVTKAGKFRPLALYSAIPTGIILILSFWMPGFIHGDTSKLVYLVTIGLLWAVCTNFANSTNMVAIVMTPNMKERDQVMSFRGIFSAVGNSAPLVIVLVLAEIIKKLNGGVEDEGKNYFFGAALCAVVGVTFMMIGMGKVKERVAYKEEKKNPIQGFGIILKNKYARFVILSDALKNFRQISTFMGIFLAAALLGSTSKYLLFGLPTGIGTAVGMLVINFLLKKFDSRTLYIASGIYSIIANTIAFGVGYTYFKTENPVLQIIFIVTLFLIGLQFGASNLLPTMFQADVLEDIEYETGKRLDASLPFVIGIGTMISGTIANYFAPKILYGEGSIIGYIQPSDAIPNPVQSQSTKIRLLFFYTIFHGIMMLLAGLPFIFYKLTGETKEAMHNALMEKRKTYSEAAEAAEA